MAANTIQARRESYFRLSSDIAQLDNAQLLALFEASETSQGWGKNHTLDLGGSKVFVKRVPMTALEFENQFSTRNLYDLPTYYNYGVGSAGFGVFRELLAHIKTTNWALNEEIETFPLMYHSRFLPFSGARQEVNPEESKKYVKYWGGNENIGRYMRDRANASHELVLFLEYFPHILEPWLLENPHTLSQTLDELRSTITFLRQKGIIHFDAHFYNIMTDGERPYLTDFGLVLDRNFALNPDETAFFDRHIDYDYGELLICASYLICPAYGALSEEGKTRLQQKYGLEESASFDIRVSLLLRHLEEIHAEGIMGWHNDVVSTLLRYRSIATLMNGFYSELRENERKDTTFPSERLQQLLNDTGVLSL